MRGPLGEGDRGLGRSDETNSVYYYFKNKEDLCVKLMDVAMETYATVLKESLKQPGNMRRRLASLFTSLYTILRANTDFLGSVIGLSTLHRGRSLPTI